MDASMRAATSSPRSMAPAEVEPMPMRARCAARISGIIAAVRRSLSSENPTELGLGERRANGVAVDPEIVRLGIGSDGNIVTADALTKGTVRHGCTGPAHDATAKQSTNGDRRRASSAAWSGCCAGRCSHRSARRAIVANSDSTSPVTGSWL